ncbi:MAG: flavodoxin family protein [Candidatus Methanomethylophilaceae archaeon]|nr:flavodoxin family protein [Candidatus Methanomethylophilaceae archaeon]
MKVLLVNGSPRKECTFTALEEMARIFNENGVETEIVTIGDKVIQGCKSCRYCKKKGVCVIKDDIVNEIGARLEEFDGFVFGSPVYYAAPSGQIQAFMDRLFFSQGSKMRGKPAACVVSCRRGGATAAFDRLNKYFTITEMPIVSSQYWNQVHGNSKEEVLQDKEGLQTMRTLARDMTWLMKCIEAGKKAGIELPAREPWEPTNFIR